MLVLTAMTHGDSFLSLLCAFILSDPVTPSTLFMPIITVSSRFKRNGYCPPTDLFQNSKYWVVLWIFLCYNVTLHPPAANLLNTLQFSTSLGSSWPSISTTMSHPFALLFSVMLYPVSIFSLTTGSRWSFFKCPQGLSSILQALSQALAESCFLFFLLFDVPLLMHPFRLILALGL